MLDAPVSEWLPVELVRDLGESFAGRIMRLIAELQISRIPPDWPARIVVAPAEAVNAVSGWPAAQGRIIGAQPVGEFGGRIAAAAAECAAAHPGPMLIIRADCPYLDGPVFAAATRALRDSGAVIGPTTDGDFYLLGFQSAPPAIFENIDWGTNQVFFEIERRASEACMGTVLIDPLERVTNEAAWRRAIQRTVPPELRGGV